MRRRALLAGLLARPALAQQPAVVASFSILGDMVRQLAGERVALRVLAGPETDAHAFQPRPSEAEALRGAAVILRNGLGFEPWLDRLLAAAAPRGRVVTVTEGLTPLRLQGGPDPHAWQDVRLAAHYARAIAAALEADPAPYLARLAALDAWVREQVATVPPERRVVLTSHDSFGYFAAAYGVRVLSAGGVAAGAQPSAARVAALIRQVRAEGITAVFLDGPGAGAVTERLARDAGVAVSGRLFADTLSRPDGPAPSYEAMVRHNVGLLVPAMRG